MFVLLFTLVSGLIGTFAALGATGPTAEEDGFATRVAAERSAAGLAAYAAAGDLADVARRHAQRMASEDRLYHNPSLGSEVQGWQAVGENVGVGASVDDIHRAFMASSTHRHAILSPEFTQVGMGVVFGADGRLWVAQVFRRPAGAAGGTAPAPGSAAAPAPAAKPPVARPAPAAVDPAVAAQRAAARAAAEAQTARAEVEAAVAEAARLAALEAAAQEADAAAVRDTLAADLAVATLDRPAPPALVLSTALPTTPTIAGRDVTAPIGLAAALLLAVVLGLLAEVGRYPLSDWRRQRNQASMSSSRSPSSTAWTLPVS